MSEPIVVVYGKAVDDKELGIYIEDVYFGGIAANRPEAARVAQRCVNSVQGGTAILRMLPLNGTLHTVFREAKTRFHRIERDMVEAEAVMEANQRRSRASRS